MTQRANESPITETTTFIYNQNGSGTVQEKIDRNYTSSWLKVEFGYDMFGNIESQTVSSADAAPLLTDSYVYSTDGRFVKQHTNKYGFSTNFEFDGLGRLSNEINYLGQNTSYHSDWMPTTHSRPRLQRV